MKKNTNALKLSLLLLLAILFSFAPFFLKASVHADGSVTPTPTPTASVEKTLTYKGSAQANGVFVGRGVTVTLPSNIQSGDLLIAVAGTNGPKSSWSIPDGWTLGNNSNSTDTQGITWWWRVADGSEGGSTATFRSSKYADGGIVVNVYHGAAASPIAGGSDFTTSDNFGNGYVSSANVSGVTLGTAETAVPLIFASWQPNGTTVTLPNGFTLESTANDGYSYVAVAESIASLTTNTFPGYTISFTTKEAVVQTLQVLIRVQ